MISYKIFILFLMLLMHYIEDFHLQGCLANLKQKKWWEKEVAENLFHSKDDNPQHRERLLFYSQYRNDYKMSLFAHSIENALFVTLPLIVDMLSLLSYPIASPVDFISGDRYASRPLILLKEKTGTLTYHLFFSSG